jgi:tetratricopeptide (TPR) repeat protein
MLRFRRLTIWALVLMLFAASAGVLAQTPSTPPDVQAILKKVQSGQQPTQAEMKRMEEWSQSMQSQYGGSAATPAQNQGGSNAAPAAGKVAQPSSTTPSAKQSVAKATPGSIASALKTPCPPAHAVAVPRAAPSPQEYTALIHSLVDKYGQRIGAGRAEIDRTLAQPDNAQAGGGIGAALFITGAVSAAVYSSAIQVQRHPEDLQAADNLAVALDTIPDSVPATQVFLYIRKMTPDAALPALNLGWSYFNSGNSTLAQQQFQDASRLGPDLSGPDAGLGMLAACRGDQATALSEFRKSLKKGYSNLVYLGYENAQQGQQDQQPVYDVPEEPAGDADSSPIPELPVSTDPQVTAASEAAFQHAMGFTDQRLQALWQDLQDAQNRILALGRRAQLNPDGTLDLPRVFDKQLFEYGQIMQLTLGHAIQQSGQQAQPAISAIEKASNEMTGQAETDAPRIAQILRELTQLRDAEAAACLNAPDPNVDACVASYEAKIKAAQAPLDEIAFRECKATKSLMDTDYSQEYKIWKEFSDSLRESTRDLYAYSQPVIDEVWAPALNDYLQAQRELVVLGLYKHDAQGGVVLAGLAKGYRELKCVPPPPPESPKTATDPALKKKKSNCPLVPPVKLGLVVVEMELGCDKVKISGGEVLRFQFERNFEKKETAFGVGLGAAASLPKIDLGGGNGLGENGESGSFPGSAAGAAAKAEMMLSIRTNDAGAVQDVGFQSTVVATGNLGPAQGAIGLTGTISLENGASVDPILSGSVAPPTVSLPGGFSWTPPGK